jgi:hypothetical protein
MHGFKADQPQSVIEEMRTSEREQHQARRQSQPLQRISTQEDMHRCL